MIYPPLTLEVNVDLDVHTAEFIGPDPIHLSAPAQAIFQLSYGEEERFFAARLAPLNFNWNWQPLPLPGGGSAKPLHEGITWVPVLREIHYEAQGRTEGRWITGKTCLVFFYDEAPRLPRGEVLSPQQIEEFWRNNVATVYGPSMDLKYQMFLAETIMLAHCYYHRSSGLGLAMFTLGECWFAGLQEDSQDLREDVHKIDVGTKWMRGNPTDEDDLSHRNRGLIDLSNKEFRAKFEALLRQPHSKFRYAMEFYQTDEEQRCREVLKCSPQIRRLVQKRCEIEVLHAMSEGGSLNNYIWVGCRPWVDRPLTVVTKDRRVWGTTAPALQQRFAEICSQLGAIEPLPVPPTDGSPDSLRQKVRYDWAALLHFEVEVGSAHEVAVRISSLLAEIEVLEAELANTCMT